MEKVTSRKCYLMITDKKLTCYQYDDKTRRPLRALLYGDKTRDKMEMVTSTGGESLSPAAECMARVVGSCRGRPVDDDDGDDGANGNRDDGVGDDGRAHHAAAPWCARRCARAEEDENH